MQMSSKYGFALLVGVMLITHPAPAHAATDPATAALGEEVFDPSATPAITQGEDPANGILQLEASLNGQPTGLILTVHQMPDGKFGLSRAELAALRIEVPPGADEDIVGLDSIEMLAYVYDESRQRLEISLPPERLKRTQLSGQQAGDDKSVDAASPGLVLNYSAYASSSFEMKQKLGQFDGASLALEARTGTKFGVLQQSGFITSRDFRQAAFTRLESSWSYDDPKHQVTWRAGDIISNSLPWTRSLRLGGLQLQRDFSLRPGLITMPLPAFSGTAALPSTVEVYVNNTKTYSTEVPSGPFSINEIPVLTGGGKARFVLHDAAGQQRVSETDFYTSADLLASGLMDFSAEAGFARLSTGEASFDYARKPVASLTGRYGLSDRITGLGHLEAGAGLANASLGARVHLGDWGMVTLGAGASINKDGRSGWLGHVSYDKQLGPVSFGFGTTRLLEDYLDIADITLRPLTLDETILGYAFGGTPRAADQMFIGSQLPWEGSFLSLGLANLDDGSGNKSTIGSLSFGQQLSRSLSVNANSFVDFRSSSFGLVAGLSMQLGPTSAASADLQAGKNGVSASADYIAYGNHAGNDWQFSAGHSQGEKQGHSRANLGYRTPAADLNANVSQSNAAKYAGSASAEGALVLAGGNLFASRHISDSYAVVDVGAPGVQVLSENRPIGRTGRSGKILLPNLRGYEVNHITLDPTGLPLDADLPVTSASVRPARGSGVLVQFRARQTTRAALVVLQDAAGKAVEVGAIAKRGEGAEEFTVGYDGETYIQGLEAENTITVITSSGQCTAQFSYSAESAQPVIGPVPCT